MSEVQIPVGSHRAPTVLCAYPFTTDRLFRNATGMRRKRGYQNLGSMLLRSRIPFSLQVGRSRISCRLPLGPSPSMKSASSRYQRSEYIQSVGSFDRWRRERSGKGSEVYGSCLTHRRNENTGLTMEAVCFLTPYRGEEERDNVDEWIEGQRRDDARHRGTGARRVREEGELRK